MLVTFLLVRGGGSSSYCKFSRMDMALVFGLSSNVVSSIGWYVHNGASRHMIYEKSLFDKF
jgi:hypothetical protein